MEAGKNVCCYILKSIENYQNLLKRIIWDELWFFVYDPETKHQCLHWKTLSSLKAKEVWMSKIQGNDDWFFFSIFMGLFTFTGFHKVNLLISITSCKFFLNSVKKIRKKLPKLRKDKSWIQHLDNALAHSILSVTSFVAKYSIPVLNHPPSLDCATSFCFLTWNLN